MCELCCTPKLTQAKLGLLLGFTKCCIKAYITNNNTYLRYLAHQSLSRSDGFLNIGRRRRILEYHYNKEKEMIMCDECALLYNTDKEAQLAKFKPSVGFEKALERLNLKNPFNN
jgi:hypothetical protein